MEQKNGLTLKSFLTSVLKYSVATWVNFIIYGVSLLLITYFLDPAVFGPVDIFISTATLFMNITVLGLDQSYIRFFNEPPCGLSQKNLFGVTIFIALSSLTAVAVVVSVFFAKPVLSLFFEGAVPTFTVALLFVNAAMLMFARFFNIMYRMAGNIKLYTLQSILMQFFSRMFYLAAVFIRPTFSIVVLFCTLGLTVFSAIFIYLNKTQIIPEKAAFNKSALRILLPYGLALAPTSIMLWFNSLYSKLYVAKTLGNYELGIFSMVTLVSNVIGVIQAGFATFWSAFIYANYKTEQDKIIKVHDYLTFAVTIFFALLVAFEELIFFVLGASYKSGMSIFPILSLVPIFLIISETTVYGISIAKKPIYDTIGIAISLVANIAFSALLIPPYKMAGAAAALALSGIAMFVFRSAVGQRFYKTIDQPVKTALVLTSTVILAVLAYYFSQNFSIKLLCCFIYFSLMMFVYKKEMLAMYRIAKPFYHRYIIRR